ncbi:unnamed protein product [Calypogeia fissa]
MGCISKIYWVTTSKQKGDTWRKKWVVFEYLARWITQDQRIVADLPSLASSPFPILGKPGALKLIQFFPSWCFPKFF